MAQKAVKSITVGVGGGATWKIVEAAPPGGATAEALDVTVFGDTNKAKIPAPQPEQSPIPFTIADEGTGAPAVGVPGTYTFGVDYTDGSSSTTITTAVSGFLSKADPATISVNGERRPVWNCELVPSGGGGTSSTTQG